MKNSIKDVSAIIRKMPLSKFANEHGENFIIYSNGNTVFMEGSETEAMVDESKKMDGILPLFNPSFNIWSPEELFKLGSSLQDVAVQNGYSNSYFETYEYAEYKIYARARTRGDDAFAIDENGKLKGAQDLGGESDVEVLWYEIYDSCDNLLTGPDEIGTLDRAKAFIDNLLDNE